MEQLFLDVGGVITSIGEHTSEGGELLGLRQGSIVGQGSVLGFTDRSGEEAARAPGKIIRSGPGPFLHNMLFRCRRRFFLEILVGIWI